MPRFPACEWMIGSQYEKSRCAEQKLLQFLYENIKYPAGGCIEGMVIARFVVETDGTISNIEILRDLGGRIGNEVKRVIELMNKKGIRWIPGQQAGEKVRVRYIIPIRIRLK